MKNNTTFDSIKSRLLDEEINYQKITDITYAVATEKDDSNNLVGNGRNAGNRFESILRYALQMACHDIKDPEDTSKADLSFGGIGIKGDFQIKRYQPGFAQISTLAGIQYFTELSKLYKARKFSGKAMQSYFKTFDLPPDFLQVQDNKSGETFYYFFNVEDIVKSTRKLRYNKSKIDSIDLLDKNGKVIIKIKDGEDSQSNCFTRGAWVNTYWLKENVEPIITNVANKMLDINSILWNY